jgi:PAS domain S-box-containing protein
MHDVTERKRTREALRAREEYYRIAFQTSLDAITITRVDDGKFVEVNKAFFHTLGYEHTEAIGRTSLELGIWTDSRDRQNLVEMMLRQSSCRDLGSVNK